MDTTVQPYLGVILREQWGALPPREGMVPMEHPVANVIYTYNTDTEPCLDKDSCKKTLRELQKRFMDQGLVDLPYNFVVGGDLNLYEGRGFKFKPSKQEKFEDVAEDSCVEIAFIGDHRDPALEHAMVKHALKLVSYGLKHMFIRTSYAIKEGRPKLNFNPSDQDSAKRQLSGLC